MARKTLKDAKFPIGAEVWVQGRLANVVGRAVMTSNKIVYTLQLEDYVLDGEIVGSFREEFVAEESELASDEKVHVLVEIVGSEENTSSFGQWTLEETATIVKLAKDLNEDLRFPLQPFVEVTVNSVKVVEHDADA